VNYLSIPTCSCHNLGNESSSQTSCFFEEENLQGDNIFEEEGGEDELCTPLEEETKWSPMHTIESEIAASFPRQNKRVKDLFTISSPKQNLLGKT
jgi:hypothetical protein